MTDALGPLIRAGNMVVPQYLNDAGEWEIVRGSGGSYRTQAPVEVAEESFSSSGSLTKEFTAEMDGIVIVNDGTADLTLSVHGKSRVVKAGESYSGRFRPFTTVIVTSTGPWRAEALQSYVAAPVVTQPSDTVAPSNVTNLVASNVVETGLTLTWTAATDNVAVTGYDVYRGASLVGSVTGTTFNATGLTQATQYTYTVKAKDAAGNASSGTPITVTTAATPVDTTPPTNVTNVTTASVTHNSLTVSWSVSSSSDVASYEVYQGATLLGTVTGTQYNVTGLTPSTQYTFTIKARDASSNVATGTSVTISTNAQPADVTPPANVTNLASSAITQTGVTLSWTTSIASDIKDYRVYDGTTLITTVTGTTYNVAGLTASTQYTFTVKARDTSDNEATGTSINVTTSAAADTTAPNAITGLTAGTPTETTVPLTWTLSSSGDVTTQEVAYSTDATNFTVASAVVNASSTAYTVTGLTANTAYTLRVVAVDGAGNRSTSVTVTATTAVAASDVIAPTVSASPAAGTYGSAQSVTLTPSETATIYVTTDGSLPTESSPVYSGPIAVSTPTIVKYFAKDAAGNKSPIYQDRYIVGTVTDAVIPTLTATPATGTYNADQVLTVSANESSIIYYTTHATTPPAPTSASAKYTGPITVNATIAYSFIAIDASGNQSAVLSRSFTIDKISPAAPTNFLASTKRGTSMVLTWTAVGDATAYLVYDANDFLLGTITGTTFEVIGLVENTEYTFKVKARDAAQNLSTAATVTDSTITSAFTATGYVNDASLLLLTEGPINLASFFNPNRFFNGNEKFTLAFTVNAPVNTAILSRWVFGQDANSRISFTKDTTGKFNVNMYGTNTTTSAAAVPHIDSLTNLYTDNALHHVVLVRNNPIMQLYVDDVKVAEGSTQAPDAVSINSSTLPMFLGAAGKTITYKNVSYYNRALTTAELTQNYNALK